MAIHSLDHGNPIWPDPVGGKPTDITDETERYAFFENQAQQNLMSLRNERNIKIAATDWTQNPDVPESTRNKWITYRQELRDITKTATSVGDVIWPTPPS
tara:strand:+ start:1702 stop:2001 length:300 start_codon:yes stop_codon:yes gene_type:complete